MTSADWDARYSAAELVWGTEPNRFVAAELEKLETGRALDLACGEGRNAIWLATRGWRSVGLDFSSAAIERARRLAGDAGVEANTEFVVGDAVQGPLPEGPFDVVIVAYLHLPADQRRRALRAAAQRLAPGGTLVVVGHDADNIAHGVGGPQNPAVLFSAQDLAADLDGIENLTVEKAEQVRRPVQTPDGERSALDALLVARRGLGM